MKYVFLHGLGQTAASWEETLAALRKRQDAICPELTDWCHGTVCYQELYAGLCETCAQLEGPVALCGESLGGVLALQYTIEHPDKVESLVLIGAQVTMPKNLLKLQNLIFRLLPESTFAEKGFQKEEVISLCDSMASLNFRDELNGIHCPVLVLCGQHDKLNRPAADFLQANVPLAEMYLLADAGHEPNREVPQLLAKTLNVFWGDRDQLRTFYRKRDPALRSRVAPKK